MDTPARKDPAETSPRGGRRLDPAQARAMVRVREARRAYRKYHIMCFWSCPPDLKIGPADVTRVAEQLMKHGGREAWDTGARLCG